MYPSENAIIPESDVPFDSTAALEKQLRRNGDLITCAFKPQAIQAIILSVGCG